MHDSPHSDIKIRFVIKSPRSNELTIIILNATIILTLRISKVIHMPLAIQINRVSYMSAHELSNY